MLQFNDFINEKYDIDEAALIVSGKKAYPKFDNILVMSGGAGCFDGTTLVRTEKGYKSISDIHEGEFVYTINENTGKEELKPVLEVMKYAPVKRMLEITFDNGETVICSEDHEFYVDGQWIEAKDL